MILSTTVAEFFKSFPSNLLRVFVFGYEFQHTCMQFNYPILLFKSQYWLVIGDKMPILFTQVILLFEIACLPHAEKFQHESLARAFNFNRFSRCTSQSDHLPYSQVSPCLPWGENKKFKAKKRVPRLLFHHSACFTPSRTYQLPCHLIRCYARESSWWC